MNHHREGTIQKIKRNSFTIEQKTEPIKAIKRRQPKTQDKNFFISVDQISLIYVNKPQKNKAVDINKSQMRRVQ